MLKITKIPTHAPYIASYICLVSRRRRWPLGQLHVNLLRIRRMAALGFSVGSQHGQQRRQHIKARVLCVCVCVGIARMLRSAVQFPAKSSRSSVFRCCPTARDWPANGSPAFKLFTRGSLAELLIVYWRNVEWKLITKIYSLSSASHYSWLPLLNLIISSTFKSINKANSSAANKASLCSLLAVHSFPLLLHPWAAQ